MDHGAAGQDEARNILKNIILVSVMFFLLFTGKQGLMRLQSSLHQEEGVGVISTAVSFLSLILFGLLLPKMVMSRIGPKWTMTISLLGSMLWMAANGYAVWATMVPASIILGMTNSLLWAAQGTYFTLLAPQYAKLTRNTIEAILPRFFGLIIGLFQGAAISGAIISSSVLASAPRNVSMDPNDPRLDWCGPNACPNLNVSNPNMDHPPDRLVWLLLGIFLGIALLGFFIVVFFVDDLPAELRKTEAITTKNITAFLLATARFYRTKEALLIFPITVYTGMEFGFFTADFSQSYVSCSIGIWMVGYVTIPFGVINMLACFISAHVAKHTGSLPFFLSAMVVDLCMHFTLMFWLPRPSQAWVLFVLSGLWGYTDGIWNTHLLALYGILFTRDTEAAFSCRIVGFSIGSLAAFGYSYFLCTFTKIIILSVVLVTGMIGYLIVMLLKKTTTATCELDIDMSTMDTAGPIAYIRHQQDETIYESYQSYL